jgi:ABC-type multidrug transport system ATPase subunit
MWDMVRNLRKNGVTIILTTHYIEEAEEMADRVGVISKGELMLVEEKDDADAQARHQDSSCISISPRRSPSAS